jgi:Tfp pilus assembly protein PilN
MERLYDALADLFHYIVAGLAAFIGLLVRKVFTAEKKIALLETHLEQQKAELTEVRDGVKRIEGWIMEKSK